MVTVAFPWVLWGTALSCAGVMVAHLLSVVTPRQLALPTARFVPDRVSRAVSRSPVPTDLWLLALRLLALALLGAALAGVSWRGARLPIATLLVIEPPAVAGAGDDSTERRVALRDVATRFAPIRGVALGQRLLLEEEWPAGVLDTLSFFPDSLTLAARLLLARRAVGPLTLIADSVRLVLVSSLRADETSPALGAVRATWPGRIDVVRLENPVATGGVPIDTTGGEPRADLLPAVVGAGGVKDRDDDGNDDVVAAAYARWPMPGRDSVRVRRERVGGALLPDDSAFAARGGVLVRWPVRPVRPGDSVADVRSDSLRYAVATSGAALVAPLMWMGSLEGATRAVVWWSNGEVAVGETDIGAGCVREVAFGAPAGDALLDAAALPVLRALAAPCGATQNGRSSALDPVLDASRVLAPADSGPVASAALLPAGIVPPASPLTRPLLLAALLVLLAEHVVRRSRAAAALGTDRASIPVPSS